MISVKTILITLAVLAGLGFLYMLSRRKSISFDFDLGGNLENLLGMVQAASADPNASRGAGIYIDVPMTTFIKNNKRAATTLSNILGSISYNGQAIIQTKADSTVLQSVTVAGKTSQPVTDSVQLLINPSTIKFLTELVQKKKPLIKYNFATTINGKPFSFTNTSTINKSQL